MNRIRTDKATRDENKRLLQERDAVRAKLSGGVDSSGRTVEGLADEVVKQRDEARQHRDAAWRERDAARADADSLRALNSRLHRELEDLRACIGAAGVEAGIVTGPVPTAPGWFCNAARSLGEVALQREMRSAALREVLNAAHDLCYEHDWDILAPGPGEQRLVEAISRVANRSPRRPPLGERLRVLKQRLQARARARAIETLILDMEAEAGGAEHKVIQHGPLAGTSLTEFTAWAVDAIRRLTGLAAS